MSLESIDKEFGITSPRLQAYDAVESKEALERNEVDVFVSIWAGRRS